MRAHGRVRRPRRFPRIRALVAALSLLAGLAIAGPAAPAAAIGCPICFGLITTYDPDGTSGPAAPVTRYYKNLTVDTPWALDVDGSKPPVPILGILQPLIPILPGYEVGVTVAALDPDKPTVTISRLSGTPVVLPLRVELVLGDPNVASSAKKSIGYDTLSSTAPTTFKAVIDTSDRDHIARTTQVHASLTLTGAPKIMTLLEEEYTGDANATRIGDSIRRLTFTPAGASSTVPSSIGLDLTSTDTVTHAIMTHSGQATLAFDIRSPGGTPRTTGSLSVLPATTDLTLADVDLNSDGVLDKKIDYTASAATPHASLHITTAGQTSDIDVTDLPTSVDITDSESSDGSQTELGYHASARVPEAVVTSTTSTRTFTADVLNVPASLDLTSKSFATGGRIDYVSDARATKATLTAVEKTTAGDGQRTAGVILTGVPKQISINYSSSAGFGHVHYSTSGDVADLADLSYIDGKGQHFVLNAQQIPDSLDVEYESSQTGSGGNTQDGLVFSYAASATIPHVEIHGSNLSDVVDRAKQMDIVLDGVPKQFGLDVTKSKTTTTSTSVVIPADCATERNSENDKYCPLYEDTHPGGYVALHKTLINTTRVADVTASTPGDGLLQHGTVSITSGPSDALPETAGNGVPKDGILYRDTADAYVVSGRISRFDQLTAHTESVNQHVDIEQKDGSHRQGDLPLKDVLHADVDTDAPTHALEFRIDKQPYDANGATGPVTRTDANLVSLPTHISLDTLSDNVLGHETTTWRASSDVKGYYDGAVDPIYVPGFAMVTGTFDSNNNLVLNKNLFLDPMPTSFDACQAGSDDSCANGLFDANLQKAHDGPTQQQMADACAQLGPSCRSYVPWFYRTFACFGSETCSDPIFSTAPGSGNQGSVRLQASEAIRLGYNTGDYIHEVPPFTTLSFSNLTRFVLQGHASEKYDCGSVAGQCQYGTVDLDTDGHAISGYIRKGTLDSTTRFTFPDGFSADHLVWVFKMTGDFSGRHATLGSLTCPDGTDIIVGGSDRAGQICNGDLTA